MNSNNLVQLLQDGFHITVGAATSLVETLQDPSKREEALSQLQTELYQQTSQWAEKGEITEREARRIIDQWLSQQRETTSSSTTTVDTTATTPPSTTPPTSSASNIEELTAQVMALREELENLRISRQGKQID